MLFQHARRGVYDRFVAGGLRNREQITHLDPEVKRQLENDIIMIENDPDRKATLRPIDYLQLFTDLQVFGEQVVRLWLLG